MAAYNRFTLKVLDNGAQVWNLAHQSLHVSTLGFLVGCRNDPKWLSGAAHLVEHCLNREGESIPSRQVNRMMNRHLGSSNGGKMNVFTVHSHTSYGHHDLLRRRYLHEVFPVLAGITRDGMYDLRRMKVSDSKVIKKLAFDTERGAVNNETAENDDSLFLLAMKAALLLLYRTNPARYFGDSDLEQLSRVKLGRLKQWAQGYYVPSLMRVIMVGPNQDEAVRMVREAELDKIPSWEAVSWDYDHADRLPILEGIRSQVIERRDIKQTHVMLMWPTETYGSEDESALEVLARILKDRIEDELREGNVDPRAGVYHPEVSWEATSSHGYLLVWFATTGDANCVQDYLKRVLAVCDRIKTDVSPALEEDCFDRKNNLADDFLEDYRFGGLLVDRALMALANGDADLLRLQDYHHRMQAVTPDRLREVASKYLTTDKYVCVIVRPVP